MIGHFTRSKVTALWERRARISEADLAFAYDKEPTTLDVVAAWCAEAGAMDHFVVHCIESPDTHGTRARQVNLALQLARGAVEPPDYVGIYDADSRPDPDTLIEIASLFEGVTEMCVQQPLRYTSAAAALARERRSPVLVANALYQTTWSLIKEVPNLLAYSDRSHDRPYKKSLYLNGHGEFFTRPLIAKVGGVPEDAIADGIQIGYRLALAGESISVTQTFCDDDVPSSHTALLKQHMRWYAGNLEFWGAWRGTVRKHGWHRYRAPAIDNVLLNVTWALRPWVYGAALGVAAFGPAPFRPLILAVLLGAGAVYAYLLPLIALRLTRQRPRLRLRDWAALPIAIAFKSLGANAVLARHIVAWFCHQRGFAWHKVER